jgi:LuxR family maltose regulon positive regulatory protein
MAGPLLQTKLHVPRLRRGLVARPRLSELLTGARESALTLVSAPAGFGKTTLLAEWLATDPVDERSVAWLALDERDNDPALFWTYLVAALQTAAPEVGAAALALLQSSQSPMGAGLTTLLNDLHAVPHDVVLVLDDYHVIESRKVQDGMAFLLAQLPPQIHLVIAGRADPAMPLARLRGRGELVEIRAAELRFTPAEAAEYLTTVMGLTLAAGDIAALEGRTEGWIAALQLAALSLRGRDDVAGFIADFAGDDRYIVDYLAEEVLQRQPEHVRRFLLETSILSRLGGSLCDAVTGRAGGKATLEALDRGNLFLVPLDDRRQWYRYHHLFADVLHARLLDEQPGDVPGLHRRASDWYEQHGEPSEAVRHALTGQDFGRAADLVELAIPALRRGRQEATLRRWLEALPDEVVRVRPVLSIGYVGSLMVSGQVEGVEERLRDAEQWLDPTTAEGPQGRSGEMVVADEAGFRALPSAIAMYRAGRAVILGDATGTMSHARRALDLAGSDDHVGRGAAAALLALGYWTTGDLDAASRWYADGMAHLEQAGQLSDVIGCAIALADIQIAQGRLREAMGTYAGALQLATPPTGPVLRGAADMHVGIAGVLLERGDLEAARRHLATSDDVGEHAGLEQNRYRWRLAMARLRQAEGDLGGALGFLDDASNAYISDYLPDLRPVAAMRARTCIAMGRSGEELGWVRERALSVGDDLDHLREFEHITLARALVARFPTEDGERSMSGAVQLLERLLRAAEEGGRTGSVLDVLVVQAVAHQTRGDMPAALPPLRRALALAEPEGHVRVFIDEGAPMGSLLRAVAGEGVALGLVRRLLAALDGTSESAPVRAGPIVPLSARELEVLRLLGSDLGGPDIAGRLFVSVNTLRTHTKNIYAKLGVTNRRAAVRRGEELHLLARTSDGRSGRAVIADR